MDIQVLIVGQGLSGTLLSHALKKAGISFVIIDESKPNTASKVAAGLINPVTGKRLVKSWLIDELIPWSIQTYGEIDQELGISSLKETSIIDFFPTPEARVTFLERQSQDGRYLSLPEQDSDWQGVFNYPFGFGVIGPAYLLDIRGLLNATRKHWMDAGLLISGRFEPADLMVGAAGVTYQDIHAEKIIFCDGIQAESLPWFQRLPFAPNKGEALIIEVPEGLPAGVFKERVNLVPLDDRHFWVGSTYQWNFTDDQPSEAFRKQTESILREWLRGPYKVVDHLAAIRPATLERQPFVGFHPIESHIGILGGMGMKGCSMAPYFTNQLVQHLVSGSPILPQADVKRFSRILGA
jgi:glycine/D-amino acid oxidase-like deaminating enzyme